MWTFVMAMILYPDVQKKAQEEIDRVVGSDRLPDFQDRKSLPYGALPPFLAFTPYVKLKFFGWN